MLSKGRQLRVEKTTGSIGQMCSFSADFSFLPFKFSYDLGKTFTKCRPFLSIEIVLAKIRVANPHSFHPDPYPDPAF